MRLNLICINIIVFFSYCTLAKDKSSIILNKLDKTCKALEITETINEPKLIDQLELEDVNKNGSYKLKPEIIEKQPEIKPEQSKHEKRLNNFHELMLKPQRMLKQQIDTKEMREGRLPAFNLLP